ncbi:hypothetical protein [Candidatus Methylospira mobilis]|uniref:hypothetical protein n=1 Tax=Candidatus Methylospira mobilis TaxID=1808979 RepID=UPI001D173126|nr:hypothetical protein [Candidatus Methylospira mobilis]
MLKERDPDVRRAEEMGVSLFVGEAEGRIEQVLLDAWNRQLQPIYNYLNKFPDLNGACNTAAPRGTDKAHHRLEYEHRRRARLSFSVLVLHHHQRAGA